VNEASIDAWPQLIWINADRRDQPSFIALQK
jgi:hypothetical protein